MSQPIRIAAAINTNAGKHDKGSRKLAEAVEPMLREGFQGKRADLAIYNTSSLDDLTKAIRDAVHVHRANVFLTVGGDGTTHQVMSRVIPECQRGTLSELPAFVIVPAGTMNVVPKALGMTSDDRISSLERTLYRLRTGRPATVRAHALRVNDKYGFLYGAGLPVNSLERYNAYEKRGMLRAVQVFGQIIADEVMTAVGAKVKRPSIAEPFGARVITTKAGSAQAFESDNWTAFLAGTIESVGVNCTPLYRARELHGHFHMIAAEHGFWKFAKRGVGIIRGRSVGGQIDDPLMMATVMYRQPMLRLFDGDMYGHDEFGPNDQLGVSPALTFLTP